MTQVFDIPVNQLREILTEQGTVVDVVEDVYADQIKEQAENDLQMTLRINEVTSRGLQWLADEEERLENYEPTEDDIDHAYRSYYGF